MNNDTQLPPITFSPEGPYRCGDTVTGTWTLRNWSDSANSDMRLRFLHAEGVQIIPERSRIPGVAQSELRAAFSADSEEGEGVRIGNLEPGERMVAVVAFKIGRVRAEDEVWMQAVVDVPTGERLLSQRGVVPVRLTARVSVPAPEIFKLMSDNQNFGMKMKIVNEGGIAERDVVVKIPIPDVLEVSDPMLPEGASVDFDDQKRTMRIKIDSIAPYQHEEIGLQFRASDALVGDLVEITDVVVLTPSSGAFHLEPIPARMERHVEFTRSAIMIEPGPYVESGAPVLVTVHVHNHGRSAARDIRVSVDLPEALIYASGSLAINGAHDARRDEIENIILPLVRAHTTTPITFNATVRSPISNQQRYNIGARIDGVDIEPLEIAVESYPNFPVEENYVFVEGPQTVEPRAERDVVIKVTNTGTEVSRQVRVRIDAPEISINRASVEKEGKSESAGIIPIFRSGVPSSAIDLNEIGPQENRLVRLSITAPETFVHGTEFPLVCYVRHDGGDETILDEITFVGRSFPHISANESHIKSSRTGSLRVGQPRNISIYLKNDGSDVATKVRVSLDLPSSLKIENVSGAELNADGDILFHDIAAQASAEATVTLRMTGVGTGEGTLEIHPIVSGERMNTISLEPLVLQTSSQSFIDEIRVEVVPVEQDSSLVVRMTFRNIGDGEANNVVVRSTNLDGYAINTTTLDSAVIRDIKGQSPLAYGLNLPSIAPGSGVEVTYCVNPSDQAYTPEFIVETDDQPQITVKGEPYQARLKYLFMPQYLGADNNRSRLSGATETKALPAPAIDAIYREIDKPKTNVPKEEPKKEESPINQNDVEIKPVQVGESRGQESEEIVKAWNAGSPGTMETDHSEISSSSESADSSGESKSKNNLDRLTEVANKKEIPDPKPVSDAINVVEVKNQVQDIPEQAEATADDSKQEHNQELTDKPKVENNLVEATTTHEQSVDNVEERAQASTNHEAESAQVLAAAEALIEQPKTARTLVIEDDEEDEDEIVLSPTSLLKQRTQVKEEQQEEEVVVRGPSRLRFRNRDEEKVTAPLIVARYDKERIEQIRTAVDLLFRKEQIGCYRHVLAMRLFVGERIVGADAEINTAWDDLLRSTKNDLKTPLMRLVMPTFKPDGAWAALLGSPEALEATEMLMANMPKLIESNAVMTLPELDDQDVYGSVQIGNFGYFESGEEASIAFIDAIIPEMIPTKSEKWPEFAKELKIYRDALAAHFKTTAYKSPMLRHEQMGKSPNAELDDALTAVILALESEMI